MRRVVLVTHRFPWFPGEQFLETEIRYWAREPGVDLVIMPLGRGTKARELPPSISVDDRLAEGSGRLPGLHGRVRAFASPLFRAELAAEVLRHPRRLSAASRSFRTVLFLRERFRAYLEAHRDAPPVFYTYWYTEATYALQSLKEAYPFKLVTRVHGFDLYEERRRHGYVPFRRRFPEGVDEVFVLTKGAGDYLLERYGLAPGRVTLAPLGVEDPGSTTPPTATGALHVVSCSFVTEVKRLDRLIEALARLASRERGLRVRWTHIGGGELEARMKEEARRLLGDRKNLAYTFLGTLPSPRVQSFYRENPVDVFVNTSSSEGVPVSVMEAMSHHIPIIAPEIGGLPDMVEDGGNGVLLSARAEVEEVVAALSRLDLFKASKTRRRSYEIFKERYDAARNYPRFIASVKGDP